MGRQKYPCAVAALLINRFQGKSFWEIKILYSISFAENMWSGMQGQEARVVAVIGSLSLHVHVKQQNASETLLWKQKIQINIKTLQQSNKTTQRTKHKHPAFCRNTQNLIDINMQFKSRHIFSTAASLCSVFVQTRSIKLTCTTSAIRTRKSFAVCLRISYPRKVIHSKIQYGSS